MTHHPAPYSEEIILLHKELLRGRKVRALDPFAGVGRGLDFVPSGSSVTLVEIEPEWADVCRTAAEERGDLKVTVVCGDARTSIPRRKYTHIFTSPCLTPDQRLLTSDLRWVPCGDLVEGDELLAFDEFGAPLPSGRQGRRKWRRAIVTFSRPAKKRCVRVVLSNGDEITCTHDHPWLAHRSRGYVSPEWIAAEDLTENSFVLRQLDTWEPERTYDAGWLAGMFDGEGSLSFGVHGAPKLMICQVVGPVFDNAERLLNEMGLSTNVIVRPQIDGRQKVANLYITDGFPGLLKALGTLRPMRLLSKLEGLDEASRCVEPNKVRVIAVEDIGERDIQGIETSTGTYIGEGYLMHNTYGNRFTDPYLPNPKWRRRSYAQSLKRPVSDGATSRFGFHTEQYRNINAVVMEQAVRRLEVGGEAWINVSDFYKTLTKGEEPTRMLVTLWWINLMHDLGLVLREAHPVYTKRFKDGENRHRAAYESLLIFVKEEL